MFKKVTAIQDYYTNKIKAVYADTIFDLQNIIFTEETFASKDKKSFINKINILFEQIIVPAVNKIVQEDNLCLLEKDILLKIIRGNIPTP